jgi:thiaminase/transcriptional activator TenA
MTALDAPGLVAVPGAAGPVTQALWDAAAPTYDAILAHPFLTGLTSGELPAAAFRHYVVQDAHYLADYAQVLRELADRAPDVEAASMLAEHAASTIAAERALHEEFLRAAGATASELPGPGPTTAAYTNFLLATARGGSFLDGLAAVLPCYWIYREVGRTLLAASSPVPAYARWIATYASSQFDAMVDAVLELAERFGADVGPEQRAWMVQRYAMAARYEWMFWDASYRLERWPL